MPWAAGRLRVVAALLMVVALGVAAVHWLTPPELDDGVVAPLAQAPVEASEVVAHTSASGPTRAPPMRVRTERVSTEPPLPAWPGDVEEHLPDPPGEGPLVVTVVDRGGQLVRGAQVRRAPEASAPITVRGRQDEVPPTVSSPTDVDFLGVTDRHGRCRVQAVAGQTLLATDSRRQAGIATVSAEAVAGGHLDLIVSEGKPLDALIVGLDGKGVAGAVLTAQAVDRGRTFMGSADAAGRCRWVLDGDCRYDLSARDGDRLSETVRIPEGGRESLPVRVRLLGVAAIEGRVLDPHGGPTAGAIVRVTSDPNRGSWRTRGFEFSASSDADGAFLLPLPAKGRYWVTAEHPDWAPASVLDLRVDVGKPTQVSLRLTVRGEFQGVVRWKDGPPIQGAALRFETKDVYGPYGWVTIGLDAVSGADGTYRLEGVSSDVAYNVTCTPDPSRPQVRMERQRLRPSPQHFVFEQARLMGASVEVSLATGDGAVLREVVTRLRVRTNDAWGGWSPGVDEAVAVVDGRVTIARLAPGTAYTLDVRAPGFGRVRSPAFVAGETPSLAITLPRASRLEVRVRAGSEDVAVGAEVALQEELAQGMNWTANTDIRGRVAFSDLPPGSFTVYARRGEDRPVRKIVEMTAGRTQRVELRLQ